MNNLNNMYVIYCHTNRLNKKPYIGWAIIAKAQSPYDAMMRRWSAHCSSSRKDTKLLFPRAIAKHNIGVWDHEVIDVVTERATAKHVEKLWIAQRKTCAFDPGGHGYNMTRGGDGGNMLGHVPSQKHREKLSAAFTGKPKSTEARKKMSLSKFGAKNYVFGKHRDAVTKRKIGAAQMGASGNNARMTDMQKHEIIARWDNRHNVPVTQHQLAIDNDVTQSTISRMLGGKTWK